MPKDIRVGLNQSGKVLRLSSWPSLNDAIAT
jgi:hypothetical protein